MAHKAVRYSQLQYTQPPARRVRAVNYLDGFWINLFKDYVILLLSSYKRFYLARSRKSSTKGWLFALIGVLFLALIPAPKAHAAYLDPIMPITPQIGLKQPLEFKLTEQPLMPELRVITKPPSGVNLYAPGNCTFGVSSWIAVPQDLGNANTWDDIARTKGYLVTTIPKIGAVAQTDAGYYGHVALVLAVNGPMVLIKEMNSLGLGVVDQRWVAVTDFRYIYFD